MTPEDYFKDQYFYELSRRDRMTGELNFPFTLLVILGGVIAAFSTQLEPPFTGLDWLVFGCFVSGIILLALIGGILWFTWTVYAYRYPAYSDQIQQFWNENNRDELDRLILDEYVKSSTNNAQINDKRSKWVFRAKQLLLVLGAIVFIGFVATTVQTIFCPPKSELDKSMANSDDNSNASDNNTGSSSSNGGSGNQASPNNSTTEQSGTTGSSNNNQSGGRPPARFVRSGSRKQTKTS